MTAELRSEVAGTRIRTWHLMPTDRMGPQPGASPPMRMTASWSGSHDPAVYKSVTRRSVPDGELPSDPQQTDKHRSGIQVCEKPVSLFISAARAQASRRCETQAPLSLLAFRSLDPSARSANQIAGDGMKNGFPAPNKKLAINQKQLLDRKSPIQVRIRLAPAVSQQTFGSSQDDARCSTRCHRVHPDSGF